MSGKMLVVLLAVCLVSAQAFVKRETATGTGAEPNYLETIQKQFQDLSANINGKLTETFNQENMQKGFVETIDALQKALDELKKKTSKTE